MSRRDSSTDRSDCRGSIGFMGRAGRCTSIADHYRPAVPEREARSHVSLIMCTGGEHHGARSAFQRRLKFPDQRIAPPADVFKRNAGLGFAATAFDLQPAIATIEALRDRGDACAGRPYPSIRIDHASASARVRLAHGLFGAFAPSREVLRRISESQRGLRAIWCSWRVLQRALRLRAMPLGLDTRNSLAALFGQHASTESGRDAKKCIPK